MQFIYKTFLLLCGIFGALTAAVAQQLPLAAQHPEYHGLINPASINHNLMTDDQNVSIGVSVRQQWVQLGDLSPFTNVLRGEFIDRENRLVIGGYISHDKVGITNNFGVYGRIAYLIPTDGDINESGISIGANIGLGHWRLRTEKLSLSQPDDSKLLDRPSSWYPDLGFGAYFYQTLPNKHYFYVGASVPRTFEFRADDRVAKRYPHYYGLAGYFMPLPWDKTFMEASTWVRYVQNIPMDYSFHLKIQPQDWFWFGAGAITDFNSPSTIVAEMGLNIRYGDNDAVKIGYAKTFNIFANHFGATHEFNLAWVLDTQR